LRPIDCADVLRLKADVLQVRTARRLVIERMGHLEQAMPSSERRRRASRHRSWPHSTGHTRQSAASPSACLLTELVFVDARPSTTRPWVSSWRNQALRDAERLFA
jgi:hypothetical protein